MKDALSLRDNAKHQLEQIKDIETGVNYLNKVKAIEIWAKAQRKDADLQNMIAEQKIRTQRILGGLLREVEIKTAGHKNLKNVGVVDDDSDKKLSDYGISKNESSTFQKVAAIPEEIFEQEIQKAKQESEERIELTTTRLIRAAERVENQDRPFKLRMSTYLQGTLLNMCKFHLERNSLTDAEYLRGLVRNDLVSKYEIQAGGVVKLKR